MSKDELIKIVVVIIFQVLITRSLNAIITKTKTLTAKAIKNWTIIDISLDLLVGFFMWWLAWNSTRDKAVMSGPDTFGVALVMSFGFYQLERFRRRLFRYLKRE